MAVRDNSKLVHFETDSSGHVKVVTIDGKIIPAQSIIITASVEEPMATAVIEVSPIVTDGGTAELGSTVLTCPICTHFSQHQCYDNPTEEEAHPTW